MAKSSRKETLATIIRWAGTILSSALFIWLISHQKWDVVLEKTSKIPLWAILLAVVFYQLSYGFNTLRWCILLWAQEVKITFWQAFRINWAGNFASNFLPSTIGGDGLRMLGTFRYTDRKTVAIGSVVLDRITNMAAMACLLPMSFLVFGNLPGSLLPASALVVHPRLQALFERYFPKVVEAFRTWASHPRTFVYAFLAAWPSNLLPMAATYVLARQFGMPVSFWQVVSIHTITYFVSVLPIAVNGIGLREWVLTSLFTGLGGTLEQASTLALATRFLTLLATIPGAIWISGTVTDAALNENKLMEIEP